MHYVAHCFFVFAIKMHTFTIICNTLYMKEVEYGISDKKERKESENKTIRFPLELVEEINSALIGSDVSFSSFVIQACEYALSNLDNNKNKDGE